MGWRFTGGTHRLRRVRIVLGAQAHTDDTSCVVQVIKLVDTADQLRTVEVDCKIDLPLQLLHSGFRQRDGVVRWVVHVLGELPNWQLDEQFSVTVVPRGNPVLTA